MRSISSPLSGERGRSRAQPRHRAASSDFAGESPVVVEHYHDVRRPRVHLDRGAQSANGRGDPGMTIGDAAAWVSAIGTWVAIIAAAIAVIVGYRQLRAELSRQRADADSRDRAQAGKVAVWLESSWSGSVETTAARPERLATVFFANSSTLPVYAATLYLWVPTIDAAPIIWQSRTVLPPSGTPVALSSYDRGTRDEARLMEMANAVSLEFRDSDGRRWYRSRVGTLGVTVDDEPVLAQREGLPPGSRPLDVESAIERLS
jgi:hypothetical protein